MYSSYFHYSWAVVLLPLVAGCDPRMQSAEHAPIERRSVKVVEIRSAPDQDAIRLIGRVEPGREVTLYFEVVGVVAEVFVEEGDIVRPGDPIARLVLNDYELALARAKAEYQAAKAESDLMRAGSRQEDIDLAHADHERAKARREYWRGEFERVGRLVESKAISESEYQQVAREHDAAWQEELMAKASHDRAVAGNRQQEIDAAAARVEALRQAAVLANRQLAKATLRAPFGGRVERRFVDPGAYVNVFPMGGVPVVHLVNLESVDAVISVPEALVARFAVGQHVEIASAVNPRVAAIGRVTDVGQLADQASGTYDVRVRLANPDNRFTGGMVVVARSEDSRPREAIRVPVTAIRRAYGQSPRVMVVAGDGQVTEHEVELGPVNGDEVEIVNGLGGGELLVVRGQHQIVAGDRVEFESLHPTTIARGPDLLPDGGRDVMPVDARTNAIGASETTPEPGRPREEPESQP